MSSHLSDTEEDAEKIWFTDGPEEDAEKIWFKMVQKLPPNHFKFSLNAVEDILPHSANLAIQRKKNFSSPC